MKNPKYRSIEQRLMLTAVKNHGWCSCQNIKGAFAKNSDENGCYNKDCQLRKEQNRSNRMETPISLIVIDLSKSGDNRLKFPKKEYYKFYAKLINVISNNTRNYDVKCYINSYKLGILLVNTTLDKAKKTAEKILNKTYDYFNHLNKEKYINLIQSIEIAYYPLNKLENFAGIKGNPIIIKNLEVKKDKIATNILNKNYYKFSYKENSSPHLNWISFSPNNGVLNYNYPIFVDIFSDHQKKQIYLVIKRAIDIIGASVGIILFSPLLVLIALVIKITSRGPILFSQKRLGYLGKNFTFLKFRTMQIDNDDQIHKDYIADFIEGNNTANLGSRKKPLFKLHDDKRITRLGKFLRKLSLDELPQLFVVLSGNMSLVGPRPPIPYEVDKYKTWHLKRVLEVKPGITGLWQVSGRSSTTFEEMVRLDIKYIENESLFQDIKILLKTFGAILNTEGAY